MSEFPSYEDELVLLKSAAAQAGAVAMRFFGKDPHVTWKEGNSPVSEADFAANDALQETLMHARPGYGWLSEETTDTAARLSKARTFVIDPIDGTKAFIAGRDLWCVSVALVENGKTIAGVLDCPARGEVFEATLHGGSYLNGRRLAINPAAGPLRFAGAKSWHHRLGDLADCAREQVGHIPSLAYRIAVIADNRFECTVVKPDCHDWDIAAAALILSEAGGLLCDATGAQLRFAQQNVKHGLLVAGGADLMPTMLAVVAEPAIS